MSNRSPFNITTWQRNCDFSMVFLGLMSRKTRTYESSRIQILFMNRGFLKIFFYMKKSYDAWLTLKISVPTLQLQNCIGFPSKVSNHISRSQPQQNFKLYKRTTLWKAKYGKRLNRNEFETWTRT